MGGNFQGGRGMPPIGPVGMQMPNINPEDCPLMECTDCGHDTFLELVHFRSISPLRMPPVGGHLTIKRFVCGVCGLEVDINLSRKWALYSPEDRAAARRDHKKNMEENKDEQRKDRPKIS